MSGERGGSSNDGDRNVRIGSPGLSFTPAAITRAIQEALKGTVQLPNSGDQDSTEGTFNVYNQVILKGCVRPLTYHQLECQANRR
jgi:hypothetical protein